MGFLRHRQEGLNNGAERQKCEGNSPSIATVPLGALFNASCTRLSLNRLLPSRSYLRFTGQIEAVFFHNFYFLTA